MARVSRQSHFAGALDEVETQVGFCQVGVYALLREPVLLPYEHERDLVGALYPNIGIGHAIVIFALVTV